MKVFKDGNGKEWFITINVAACKRVRGELGVDLPGLADVGRLGELLEDLVRFVDVLFVLCRPQAEQSGVTDEQFGAALGGDTLEAAAEAFVQELIDFFPAPRRGPLRALMAKGKAVSESAGRRLTERIEAIDPERPETWGPTSSGSSGDTPGPSGSTPAPSPSGS
jgi:hypothetical protein